MLSPSSGLMSTNIVISLSLKEPVSSAAQLEDFRIISDSTIVRVYA